MLKIRGRLILSFSLVIIIVLSALGSITYFTFKDSISRNKENILQLTLKNHTLSIENTRINIRAEILKVQKSLQHSQYLRHPKDRATRLDFRPKDHQYISAVVGFRNGDELLSGTKSPEFTELLDYLQTHKIKNSQKVLLVGELVWVKRVEKTPAGDPMVLYYLLDIKEAWASITKSNSTGQGSLLVVASDNKILMSHRDLTEKDDTSSSASSIRALSAKIAFPSIYEKLLNKNKVLSKVDQNYVLANDLNIFDWRLYLIVSESDFISELIQLKNRVIAATLVTFWVSIWIVLIVANTISKPIRALSSATQKIQKFDYSSRLVFKGRNDEIGDLAKSFETMRLHIEELIFKDTLTGVFNRRYLVQAMTKEVSKSQRQSIPVSFVMIDLDHFKAVNDTYGHGAGDDVLIAAGKAIESALRDYDVAARYGGEEFCLVLPSTDAEGAMIVAERVRKSVESLVVNCGRNQIRVTCSLGISVCTWTEDADKNLSSDEIVTKLMSTADNALYVAKDRGRNCCLIYTPDMEKT